VLVLLRRNVRFLFYFYSSQNRKHPPTTRSSPAPSSDSVLQLINDRLLAITQELGDIRQEFTQDLTDIRKNITDLKQTVTGFQKELPHHFESIQDQQNTFQTDTNICLDTLTMKLADTAVEFSEFQHNVETKIQELHDDPMTFTPCIINTVNAVLKNNIDNMIETRFQDLPALVTKELQKSPSSLKTPSSY
jgi:archaellum component FlaC